MSLEVEKERLLSDIAEEVLARLNSAKPVAAIYRLKYKGQFVTFKDGKSVWNTRASVKNHIRCHTGSWIRKGLNSRRVGYSLYEELMEEILKKIRERLEIVKIENGVETIVS